jgi:hypothetical protein
VTRVKAAEAEAEARYLQGLGISRQRQAILNGLRDSVADFSGRQGCVMHVRKMGFSYVVCSGG